MIAFINQALAQRPEWLTLDRVMVFVGAIMVLFQLMQGNRQHRRAAQSDARQYAIDYAKFDRPGLPAAWDFVKMKGNFGDIIPKNGEVAIPSHNRNFREKRHSYPTW